MNPSPAHVPVLLSEVVALLSPALQAPSESRGQCVLVDCTVGLGGQAEALLRACPQASLVGLDRDPQALAVARRRLAPIAGSTRRSWLAGGARRSAGPGSVIAPDRRPTARLCVCGRCAAGHAHGAF